MVYIYFATHFDNMDTCHILTEVTLERNKLCQIESGMHKNMFLYSKIGVAPV